MAVSIAPIIDQAKLVSNNRRNLAIADTDWVTFINWAIESWWKFRTSLDPGLYFSSIDFTLTGGAAGSQFNMDLAFVVRVATAAPLPIAVPSGIGVGKTLTALANGALPLQDGISMVVGDLLLVTQSYIAATDTSDNGIYVVSNLGSAGTKWVLTRWAGFDQAGPLEVQNGAQVTPTAGATLANDPFVLSGFGGTVDSFTLGLQVWTQSNVIGRFRSLHGLDVNPDTGSRYTLRSRNFRQRNESVGGWIPTTWCPNRFYDLRANMLVVTPYEASAGNYRAYYRAAPYKFATPTDTDPLDAVLEPELEAIVLMAACSALNIEETSNDPYIKRIAAIKADVQASYERDDGQAFQIADVEGLGWGF